MKAKQGLSQILDVRLSWSLFILRLLTASTNSSLQTVFYQQSVVTGTLGRRIITRLDKENFVRSLQSPSAKLSSMVPSSRLVVLFVHLFFHARMMVRLVIPLLSPHHRLIANSTISRRVSSCFHAITVTIVFLPANILWLLLR